MDYHPLFILGTKVKPRDPDDSHPTDIRRKKRQKVFSGQLPDNRKSSHSATIYAIRNKTWMKEIDIDRENFEKACCLPAYFPFYVAEYIIYILFSEFCLPGLTLIKTEKYTMYVLKMTTSLGLSLYHTGARPPPGWRGDASTPARPPLRP